MMNLGLYVHIPFCQQKCFYCDFPSYANLECLHESYVNALCLEIAAQGALLSHPVLDTIYIGGGTPTVLNVEALNKIIVAIEKNFAVSPQVESTIEVNPGTANEEKLRMLFENGINRLSFGVQSFQDRLLKKIGRIHTAKEAEEAVLLAKKIGFRNLSLDLMYGLPEQTVNDVRKSIDQAAALGIEHVSVYGLKIEDGTVFEKLQEQNTLILPSDTLDEEMYHLVMQLLPRYGYQRYEISNFAKPNFESKHNLKYWQVKPYLGVGTAAHSYLKEKRFSNLDDVKEYIRRRFAGESTIESCESLDCITQIEEFCFLALRMKNGIDLKIFKQKFNRNFFSVYGHIIDRLKFKKLIAQDGNFIYLTDLGMQYGNQVFCEFLLK
ncbi:radical SAM family heme chaperone HemW [Anaerosinus massiliensis]|uniref:radical SAM family heme chaperone HemW n=1 Tax=Massilibacillus massiliensis TaxID=1806837 RepID=UPI000AA8C009|nr:radical SAM family heme chaperone HemW [Massilibacillus massiliensis]